METENNNRKRRIYVRLTDKEFTTLESRCKNTTCRSVSDYVRHCLFSRPITTITRDASADEAITQMGNLNRELNAIGNNFNQLVRRVNVTSQAEEIEGLLLLLRAKRKQCFPRLMRLKNNFKSLLKDGCDNQDRAFHQSDAELQ